MTLEATQGIMHKYSAWTVAQFYVAYTTFASWESGHWYPSTEGKEMTVVMAGDRSMKMTRAASGYSSALYSNFLKPTVPSNINQEVNVRFRIEVNLGSQNAINPNAKIGLASGIHETGTTPNRIMYSYGGIYFDTYSCTFKNAYADLYLGSWAKSLESPVISGIGLQTRHVIDISVFLVKATDYTLVRFECGIGKNLFWVVDGFDYDITSDRLIYMWQSLSPFIKIEAENGTVNLHSMTAYKSG